MKAVSYRSYGSPEDVEVLEVDQPAPGDDDVLIRVHAASVNPYDWHMMRGEPYLVRLQAGLRRPKLTTLGADVAGRVEAVGSNVTEFQAGDEVFGQGRGSFAEYVTASPRALALKPPGVTFEQAAAVPIAGLTALQGLRDKGRIAPGHRVLINGASGGVGTFAVQIAKTYGAEVTGVCSTRNLDLVLSIGADHVVDYTTDDFTESGEQYDLILDAVGNRSLSAYRRAMTPKGVLVVAGAHEMGNWVGPLVHLAKVALRSAFSSHKMVVMLASTKASDLAVLGELLASGKVTPVIDRTYPLAETADAIRHVEEGHARGKVIIVS
ncbi:MAG: NAD(P)-dependent alcohol dehydrogenase [Acidimicrobiia bacterium]|nr:NAD(P)-dependent alcohol dehydrogenase [Acidimicrobiia bacterium]